MIYFLQDTATFAIKIGYAKDDAEGRASALQTGSPSVLELLATMPGERADEAKLHKRFAPYRVAGEWFKPCPALIGLIAHAIGKTPPPLPVGLKMPSVFLRLQDAKDLLDDIARACESSYRRGYQQGYCCGTHKAPFRRVPEAEIICWRFRDNFQSAASPPGGSDFSCTSLERLEMETRVQDWRNLLDFMGTVEAGGDV